MLKTESSLRAAGMESCARHYRDQLLRAQRIAVDLAREKGVVTSDDVREEAERRGMVLSFGKNWVGSIFKGKEWVKVGYVQSRHAGGHGRIIAQWRLSIQKQEVVSSVPAVRKTEPEKKPVFATKLFSLPTVPSYEFLP